MKKIIFFSKKLNIGGMEKSLVILLNNLSLYYDVTLVLEKKEGVLLKELSKKVNVKEYKVSTLKLVFLRKIINYSKRLIWKLMYKNKYDFSCNYATYSIIGSKLAQIASTNSAFYIHSDYYTVYNGNEKDIKCFFAPHEIEKYKKIIFVSNESKNGLQKIYPNYKDKFIVINNLVDYENIEKKSQGESKKVKEMFDTKRVNIVFIGRLDNESKNFDLLLDSFKMVLDVDKNYQLFIIGKGPYKNTIENFIANNNLKDNIYLIDETINPYIYLKYSDAIILTSNYEGFPVVYLEALVLSKMIMTTVVTSDETINIKDYSILLKHDKKDISTKILQFKKIDNKNDLDFSKINENKIAIFKKIIDN